MTNQISLRWKPILPAYKHRNETYKPIFKGFGFFLNLYQPLVGRFLLVLGPAHQTREVPLQEPRLSPPPAHTPPQRAVSTQNHIFSSFSLIVQLELFYHSLIKEIKVLSRAEFYF